jgi:Xaa-Pro aminopeptidase
MLTAQNCQHRLTRLAEILSRQNIDVVVLSDYRSIYYVTGHLRETQFPQAFVLDLRTGASQLIIDIDPSLPLKSKVDVYESYSLDWPVSFPTITAKAAEAFEHALKSAAPTAKRLALEKPRLCATFFEVIAHHFPAAEHVDAIDILAKLRRSKDPDEIELIRRCIGAIEAGYGTPRHPSRSDRVGCIQGSARGDSARSRV